MKTPMTLALGDRPAVSRLGYGAMQITGEGVWGEPQDRDAAKRLLQEAVEQGVHLIDTADSYGPEVSERLIGEALAPYPDQVVVATKAGFERTGPGQWQMNGRPEHIKAACEGSLERLRLDRIPLYQLHRIDPSVPMADSIGAMLELRAEGKIDQIGLSEVSAEQLAAVQKLTPVASVQNRFHIGDREWDGMIDVCERQGIVFMPWYPLGSGNLGAAGDALDAVASAHGTTRFVVAIAWLLHRSPTMMPIPGTSSSAHLSENMSAPKLANAITDEQWASLDGAA